MRQPFANGGLVHRQSAEGVVKVGYLLPISRGGASEAGDRGVFRSHPRPCPALSPPQPTFARRAAIPHHHHRAPSQAIAQGQPTECGLPLASRLFLAPVRRSIAAPPQSQLPCGSAAFTALCTHPPQLRSTTLNLSPEPCPPAPAVARTPQRRPSISQHHARSSMR